MSAKPWLCSAPDGLTASQERDWEGMRAEIERLRKRSDSLVEMLQSIVDDCGSDIEAYQPRLLDAANAMLSECVPATTPASNPDPRPCWGHDDACPWRTLSPLFKDQFDERAACRRRVFGVLESPRCPMFGGAMPPTGTATAAREAWEAKQKGGTP